MGQKMHVPGAHNHAHKRSSPKQGSMIFSVSFVWEVLVGARRPLHPISHTPSRYTLGRAGCCAARVCRRRGILAGATPFQLHPEAVAGDGGREGGVLTGQGTGAVPRAEPSCAECQQGVTPTAQCSLCPGCLSQEALSSKIT